MNILRGPPCYLQLKWKRIFIPNSPKVNGFKRIRLVKRLCKPPLSLMTFSIIHEAAEPQITKIVSERLVQY
jgi:hypothetical protein